MSQRISTSDIMAFCNRRRSASNSSALFVAATESFSRANINRSIEQSLADARAVIAGARPSGARVRAYISVVFGCPYEGAVAPEKAADVAARLIDESVTYARERSQGGHPIADYQLIQAMLADSQTEYMAARALVLDAAARYDAGTDQRLAPSAAKYFASEAVGRIADRAVQIHGGYGFMEDYPVARYWRDVKINEIGEGTSEVQRMLIGRLIGA